jgi:hypothetical protein
MTRSTVGRVAPLAGALLGLLAAPRPASGFDSQCRYPDNLRGAPFALQDSTCRQGAFSLNAKCDDGLEAARGAQLGEHTVLARIAMNQAGLGTLAGAAPVRYFGDTRTFRHGGKTYPSLEASGPGVAATEILRAITVAEFAQVPDMSAGLSDFLLGNEHCFLTGTGRTTLDEIQACHEFKSHLGLVNSSHFGSQARAAYGLYHGIALQKAAQCRELADATASGDPSLAILPPTLVASCEQESLIFEAVASHFLSDAWSSGHMWERWGAPVFPSSVQEQQRVFLAGLTSGFIHGWRITLEDTLHIPPVIESPGLFHDAMCMPGPTNAVSARLPDLLPFQFVNRDGIANFGAGDLYLQPCTARTAAQMSDVSGPSIDQSVLSVWGSAAVLAGGPMAWQRRRMSSCLTMGFREVYNAGPMTIGPVPFVGPTPDVPSSLDEGCWNQWATNASLYAGLESTPISARSDNQSNLYAATGALLYTLSGSGSGLDPAVAAQYRAGVIQVRATLEFEALNAPDRTNLARGFLPPLAGQAPGNNYVPAISGGTNPSLEIPTRALWRRLGAGPACTADQPCGDGSFCSSDGRCRAKEAAMLALPSERLIAVCGELTQGDVDAARAKCRQDGGGSPACRACVEMLAPLARDRCDDASHAACDTLAAGGVIAWSQLTVGVRGPVSADSIGALCESDCTNCGDPPDQETTVAESVLSQMAMRLDAQSRAFVGWLEYDSIDRAFSQARIGEVGSSAVIYRLAPWFPTNSLRFAPGFGFSSSGGGGHVLVSYAVAGHSLAYSGQVAPGVFGAYGDLTAQGDTAVAFDPEGRPWIYYLSAEPQIFPGQRPRLAHWSGSSWNVVTLDAAPYLTNLALDVNPISGEVWATYASGENNFNDLFFDVVKLSPAGNVLLHLRPESTDRQGMPGYISAVAVDGKGVAHIVYLHYASGDDVNVKYINSTTLIPETVATIPFNAATNVRVALGRSGIPYVVYTNGDAFGTHRFMRVVKRVQQQWVPLPALTGSDQVADVDIAIGSDDSLHVAFIDNRNDTGGGGELKHVRRLGCF